MNSTTTTSASRALAGGLIVRPAQPGDLDQIGSLLATRFANADAIDHALIMHDRDAGWSSCGVVTDGDKVVSTLTLLDEIVHFGEVRIPTMQVELVATDPEYGGRGLVRELMSWAHERAIARGQLIQLIVGITYFYRQFGYAYTIPNKATRSIIAPPPPSPDADHYLAHVATIADVPAMEALQRAEQSRVDLWMPHASARWRWLLAREETTHWLVEHNGIPVSTGRIERSTDGVTLAEVAATNAFAANALCRHALELAGPDLRMRERPGTIAGEALSRYLDPQPETSLPHYARVTDFAALLELLRPVLSARLASSTFADADGEALISFFRSQVRLPYAHGVVGPIIKGAPVDDVYAAGGATVPPDQFAPLLLGPDGIEGLARVYPDVYAGSNPALMHMLFPPVTSDVMTFHLPW